MITNNSIKEYYTKLQGLYSQCYDMLSAMNESLSTKSPQITMKMTSLDGTQKEVRIPSMLYIENKIEELDLSLSSLYKIPENGEAWMTKNDESYKMVLEKNNISPVKPLLSSMSVTAGITDNNFLRDLVSPKTYIRALLSDLPSNIDKTLVKKVIIYDKSLYETLVENSPSTYSDFSSLLYNYNKGSEYEEYDSEQSLPIKESRYVSQFKIIEIPSEEETGTANPWYRTSTEKNSSYGKLSYRLKVDTIEYQDRDDSTISYSLKSGDILAMKGSVATWKVVSVDTNEMEIVIDELIGHVPLQTYEESPKMSFEIYDNNYTRYNYLDLPLEEDPYVVFFLSFVANGIRSDWSAPIFLNLNNIYVKNEGGNFFKDQYGNNITYIDYYNKYCTNIGDLILGITETAYPQVKNFTSGVLQQLQEGEVVQQAVSQTFNESNILQVVPINKHLVDNVTTDDIKSLHETKNDLNQQISSIQETINKTYNTLLTTDFSKDTSVTQSMLKSQLDEYYTQKESLVKQLNYTIDSINSKATDLTVTGNSVKYRIRGVTETSSLDSIIKEIGGNKVELIGLDVEYKYKSTLKDSTNVTVVNSSTFTDWNRLDNIDRQRKLVFTSSGYGIEFVDYGSTDNIIKWNQVDIPIQQGEDVIVRMRYKLNVGQPFMSVYTPWSDEKTVIFPAEYKEDVDLTDILTQNSDDTVTASFSSTLINDGYSEHIQDKIVSTDQVFFHMPESIYSGFNTGENKMISLKDKLYDINNQIENWRTVLDTEANAAYEVRLQYDDTDILLSSTTKNIVNIYADTSIIDIFSKKKMNIVIKNIGTSRLNLYSIFPGNTDLALLDTDIDSYASRIVNYERVPIVVNNNVTGQTLGQWIYFRQNSPWTKNNIYYNPYEQNKIDLANVKAGNRLRYNMRKENYMNVNNMQALLGYKERSSAGNESVSSSNSSFLHWQGLKKIDDPASKIELNGKRIPSFAVNTFISGTESMTLEDYYNKVKTSYGDWYVYKDNSFSNNYLIRYEDIVGIYTDSNTESSKAIPLTDITTFTTFGQYQINGFKNNNGNSNYVGAFLFPELDSIAQVQTEGKDKSSKYIEVGESLVVPITLEYYVDETTTQIKKSVYFDLRPSLVSDPVHYMIEVICNYNYITSNNLYSESSSSTIASSEIYK